MNKLLCIVGPTGTGKTARAIQLSANQPSILVSADSRQVYRGMDIVTGKDHPANVTIHGTDIVDPNESCSVSVWYDAVMPPIERAWGEGKLPIVVGGTGLYVKALTQGIPTMKIPINNSLRKDLTSLSIAELQEKLNQLNSAKFTSMNQSDQNNPRRLIRAIEVSQSNIIPHPQSHSLDTKMIGLKYSDLRVQRNKIHQRVIARLDSGAIKETKQLLTKYGKNLQSMSTIGYKSIIDFIEGKINQVELVEHWVSDELAYSKRQLTWFHKIKSIKWYDVDTTGA